MIIWFDDESGWIVPDRKVCENTLRFMDKSNKRYTPPVQLRGPMLPQTINLTTKRR